MQTYFPAEPWILAIVAVVLATTVAVGYLLSLSHHHVLTRTLGWLWAVFSVALLERLTTAEPAGVRMLVLIAGAFLAMKVIVALGWQAASRKRLPLAGWLFFALGWFGMRPELFVKVSSEARRSSGDSLRRGLVRLSAGVVLVLAARLLHSTGQPEQNSLPRELLELAVLLSGLSLILHFGLFNLLAAMWQRVGVNCRTLFRAPLKSRSVSEFWGRRWNLAFSEMTSIAVFRPLSKWWGCGPAVVAGFLFSGMLHELAISLPVRAGFGLPMAYFALHALIVHLEAYLKRRGRPVEGWGWPARIWTAAWLLVPLPLLFHAAFLNELVLPLLGVRGLPIL